MLAPCQPFLLAWDKAGLSTLGMTTPNVVRQLSLNLRPHQHQSHAAVPSSWVASSSDLLLRPSPGLGTTCFSGKYPCPWNKMFSEAPSNPNPSVTDFPKTNQQGSLSDFVQLQDFQGKSVLDHPSASSHLTKPLNLLSARSAMGS